MRSAPGPTAGADLAIAQNAERVSMGFRHPHVLGRLASWITPLRVRPEPPVGLFYRKRRSRGKPGLWQGYGFLTPCPHVSTGEEVTAVCNARMALCARGAAGRKGGEHRGPAAVR
jgi:hypothetical protein